MAQVNGVNYAKYIDPQPSNILAAGSKGGKVRATFDTYTFATTASGTTVAIGHVKTGTYIIGVAFQWAALGGSTTVSVGDGGSATRYGAAQDTSSAGRLFCLDGCGYVVTGTSDNVVLLTLGGASATGAVNTAILYAVE